MALTLDGSAKNSLTTGTALTVTFTSALTNDVIIAFIHAEHPTTTPVISSVAGMGLTWTRRATKAFTFTANTAGKTLIEEWWAPAASALSAQVLTITASATMDHINSIVFAINGVADINNPFDGNGSLPSLYNSPDTGGNKNPNVGGSDRPTMDTTNSNCVLIGYFASISSPTERADTPNSWVSIQENNNSSGTNWSNTVAQYFVKSAPVTTFPVSWRDAANNYLIIGDALTADSSSATGTILSNLQPSLTHAFTGSVANPTNGTISMNLSPSFTMLMNDIEGFPGTITMNLQPALRHSATGIVGYPLSGTTNLQPQMRMVAFGNQLATAGNPSYYSWWFLGP